MVYAAVQMNSETTDGLLEMSHIQKDKHCRRLSYKVPRFGKHTEASRDCRGTERELRRPGSWPQSFCMGRKWIVLVLGQHFECT